MHDRLKIIGLSGTNGAGKDLVGELLAKNYNYLFISVTELLREEARRRDLPVERLVLRTISAEWRREYGLAVLVDRAIDAYRQTGDTYAGVVIASLRNPAEAERIHELKGINLWIDADPKVRYARVSTAHRGRAGEDNKTFEQFLAEEADEMNKPADGDSASLNMSAVKALSDVIIVNDFSELADLEAAIAKVLQ